MVTLSFLIFAALAVGCAQVYRQTSALWAMPAALGSGVVAAILLPFAVNVYFAMALLVVPLAYGVHRARVGDTPWARPLVGTVGLLIIIIGGSRMIYSGLGCADQRLVERTVAVATEDHLVVDPGMVKLGQRLAERFPRRRLLAVYPAGESEDVQAEYASLRKGWGAAIEAGELIRLGPPPPERFVPRNLDFDEAVDTNPGTELLLTFAPLPGDYERLKLFARPLAQRVPLILMQALPGQLKVRHFHEGLIAGALFMAPADVPEELKESMIRFRLIDHILVDGGNLERVLAAYPTWLLQTK